MLTESLSRRIMLRNVLLLVFILIKVAVCEQELQRTRRSNGLIVNGNNANRGKYPAFVWIFYKGNFYCGGTIINKRTIMTAAHCAQLPVSTYTVAVGKYKYNKDEGTEQYFKIRGITRHEHYDFPNNDIALFHLKGNITYNELVKPVFFARSARHERNNSQCFAVGAGKVSYPTDDGATDTPRVLQDLKTNLVTSTKCQKLVEKSKNSYIKLKKFQKNSVCSYDEDKGVCFGDGGGPVGCYDSKNRFVQVGLLSHSNSLCVDGINIFTRISQFKTWIKVNK